MMGDNLLEPNIEMIKSNDFYLFYEMMMQALRTDNVKEGIHSSLLLLRIFLQSGHIALYKKNEFGQYIFKLSDSPMDKFVMINSKLVNRTKILTETNGIFDIELGLDDNLNNLLLLHTRLNETDCIISIINYNKAKQLDALFWERLVETITIILKRAASYERNIAAITTDLLTGLENRNSYEMRLQELDESDEKLVFAIFDLFNLKGINDDFGHAVGDEYIKGTAKILSNYWQKQIIRVNSDGIETREDTGHSLYRIGGDEFVLLTNVDDLQYAKIKASLAVQEAAGLRFSKEVNKRIGVNYGVVKHNPGSTIKETFEKADELMEEDKKRMHLKYGVERRHI